MTADAPAFPGFNYVSSNVHDGMMLRDYFAARAMQGLLANPDRNAAELDALESVSREAYGVADAMLKERAK